MSLQRESQQCAKDIFFHFPQSSLDTYQTCLFPGGTEIKLITSSTSDSDSDLTADEARSCSFKVKPAQAPQMWKRRQERLSRRGPI